MNKDLEEVVTMIEVLTAEVAGTRARIVIDHFVF